MQAGTKCALFRAGSSSGFHYFCAAECADDLSLEEEDEGSAEEADKDGVSKEQAAGEMAPAAAAEELLPADAGAVPEVRFSADVMSN